MRVSVSLGWRLDSAVGLGLVVGLGCLGWGCVVSAGVGDGRLGADDVGQGQEADGFEVARLAIFGVGDLDEGGCELFKVSTGEDVGGGEEGVAAHYGVEVIGGEDRAADGNGAAVAGAGGADEGR